MYMADLRKKELTDEEIAKAMAMDEMDVKRLSTQEAINTSIAKMTELLAGPAQFLAKMLENSFVMYSVMGMIATVMAVSIATSIGKSAIALAGMIPKTATLLGLEVGRAAAAVASASALTLGLGALGIIAGIAAVMAVVNSSTKPKTPGLAKGGTVTGEGSVLVGEEGPEIMSMKPGATVTPLTKANAATIATPSVTTTIKAPSAPIQQSQAIDYDKMAQAMSRVSVNTNLDGVRVSSELQKAPLGIATRKI
jgi:uncharacterized membrane protein